MKRIILTIIAALFTVTFCYTQDIITKKTGEDIQSKVVEIGLNEIKYKKFENQAGPTYTISKADALMIRYENGTKDIFTETKTAPSNTVATYSKTADDAANQKNMFDITGDWKSPKSPGKIHVERYGDAFKYTYGGTSVILSKVYDSNNNVTINKYLANNFEFTAQNDSLITAVYKLNPQVGVTWKRISAFNNQNSLVSASDNVASDDDNYAFRSENGSGGIVGTYVANTFYCFYFAETRISKSDFGIGLDAGLGIGSYTDNYKSNSYTYDMSYVYTFYNVGVRGTYHLPVNTVFDPYAGTHLYYYWSNFDYSESKLTDISSNGLDWDCFVGTRVLLTKKFGLCAEYHVRGGATFYIGITFKL